ncbi:ethanolamine utilization protein EutQ, partial [Mycena leptocephala]
AAFTFRHSAGAQTKTHLPLIANENAFLGDVFCNQKSSPENPLTSGFFRLEPGTPLDYTYTYHEMKIILAGDFTISDASGQTVHAKPGDVFEFPKGSRINFKTEKGG